MGKSLTTYSGVVSLLFCPLILFDHCYPLLSELKIFIVRSDRYSVKFKGRFFRSTICATNCTTWIRHLGEPLDHVQLLILHCLCFCLSFSVHALIYRKICINMEDIYRSSYWLQQVWIFIRQKKKKKAFQRYIMKTCLSERKLIKQFGNPSYSTNPYFWAILYDPPYCPNFKNKTPPNFRGMETMSHYDTFT